MLEAGDDDLIAPVAAGHRGTIDGHIVALRPAGREVNFIAAAVQRFGNAGAGRFDTVLRGHGGVVQAAGVGPEFHQSIVDDLGHGGVHAGGGGVIQIMDLRVGKHRHSSHFEQNYTG